MNTGTIAVLVLSLVCAWGCSDAPVDLTVTLAGVQGASFELVNSSTQEWDTVEVTLQQMRPDGIQEQCASQQLEVWSPGEVHPFPQCGGEKTLITITTRGQQASYALADGRLYRKFGRREILVQ